MIDIDIRVDRDGPIFQPLLVHESIRELIDDVEHDVASAGLQEWSTNLNASIRNPTPYYETQVTLERTDGHWVAHDRGVIYGPWLEGVGSRNQTTRFKGYAAARRARQAIERRIPQITAAALARAVRRLNGR